ncbi:hypothetical protein N2152v2_006962 [Parachlorella kessleri]
MGKWPAQATAGAAGLAAASAAEEEANKKRWEEAGEKGSVDQWRWTLNWDRIGTYKIVVGSCPRSVDDIDRIMQEAGASAILSLQSDLCLDALHIDWPALRRHAVRTGLLYTRVAVRDFDHNDQALMLPEAVRMLHALLSMGRTVYVHCTAGINRATLTVVGYLTFVQGMQLHEAVGMVKTSRPQAHPYIDCWKTVRSRLVASRAEEVMHLAESLFNELVLLALIGFGGLGDKACLKSCADALAAAAAWVVAARRKASGAEEDGFADWVAAENMLIRETFNRQLEATLSLVRSMQDVQEASMEGVYCYSESEVGELANEISGLQDKAEAHRAALERTLEELAVARDELASLRDCNGGGGGGDPESCTAVVVRQGQQEIVALRSAIRDVARKTSIMLQQQLRASLDSTDLDLGEGLVPGLAFEGSAVLKLADEESPSGEPGVEGSAAVEAAAVEATSAEDTAAGAVAAEPAMAEGSALGESAAEAVAAEPVVAEGSALQVAATIAEMAAEESALHASATEGSALEGPEEPALQASAAEGAAVEAPAVRKP